MFKYQVGDFVKLVVPKRVATNAKGEFFLHEPVPHVGRITDRFSEECPGGTQIHYKVRWLMTFSRDGKDGHIMSTLVDHREMEIDIYDPEEELKLYREEAAEVIALRKEQSDLLSWKRAAIREGKFDIAGKITELMEQLERGKDNE